MNIFIFLTIFILIQPITLQNASNTLKSRQNSPKIECNIKRPHKNCNIYVWTANQDEFISLSNTTYNKSRGTSDQTTLRGRKIRVLVTEMYPYVMYDRQRRQLDGFIGNFWQPLQLMLQFDDEIIIENNYDRALDRMVAGEADVFLGAVVSNAKLNNATIYSQPYLLNWYLIGHKRPDVSGSSDFFVHAFENDLLLMTFVLYVILGLSLWGGWRILMRFQPGAHHLSLPTCLIAVVSGFLNQATDQQIKFTSLRIVLIISLLFGYIILTSLNAVLVSQLTSQHITPAFTSLADIAKKRTHSLCLRNTSFVYNYFLDKDRTALRPKWQGIINGPDCKDITDIHTLAEIVCNPRVIILENRPIFASMFKLFRLPCLIDFLPGHYYTRYNFIVYHKTFEHSYLFTKSLKQIKSTGILAHLEEKWFDIKTIKTSFTPSEAAAATNRERDTPAVNLLHVSGVLIMLLATMLLSIAILGAEIVHSRMNRGFPSTSSTSSTSRTLPRK